MANISKDLTLRDLRTIIHGLKMAGFGFVEEGAVDQINGMIKALPSPEELGSLANTPDAIKNIQNAVGEIMRLIEIYGKRDMEYKVRYKSKTGLPPRYKVLDWKSAGRNDMKKMSQVDIRNNVVMDLLQLSREIDDCGMDKQAENLISCSKKIQAKEIPYLELYNVTKEILSFDSDNGLKKEAQMAANFDISLGDIRNGLKQINGWFDSLQNTLMKKLDYINKHPQLNKFVQTLQGIWKQIGALRDITAKQMPIIDQSVQQMEQQMGGAVPKNVLIKGKQVPIQWVPDPSDPGTEMATVEVDGKRYEVQTDERTKGLSLKEIQQATQQQPQTQSSGTGAGSAMTISPDLNKFFTKPEDVGIIDNLLKYIGDAYSKIAKFNYLFYKNAQTTSIPPEVMNYVASLIQGKNKSALDEFVKQLNQKKQALQGQKSVVNPINNLKPGTKMMYISAKGVQIPVTLKNIDSNTGNIILVREDGSSFYILPRDAKRLTSIDATQQQNQQMALGFNLSKYLKISKKLYN